MQGRLLTAGAHYLTGWNRMNKPTAVEVIAFAGLKQSATIVGQWIDDVAVLAEDCLNSLSADKQKLAIRYLVAAILSVPTKDGGVIASEGLGDASWSFVAMSAGQSNYGRMAIGLAP